MECHRIDNRGAAAAAALALEMEAKLADEGGRWKLAAQAHEVALRETRAEFEERLSLFKAEEAGLGLEEEILKLKATGARMEEAATEAAAESASIEARLVSLEAASEAKSEANARLLEARAVAEHEAQSSAARNSRADSERELRDLRLRARRCVCVCVLAPTLSLPPSPLSGLMRGRHTPPQLVHLTQSVFRFIARYFYAVT